MKSHDIEKHRSFLHPNIFYWMTDEKTWMEMQILRGSTVIKLEINGTSMPGTRKKLKWYIWKWLCDIAKHYKIATRKQPHNNDNTTIVLHLLNETKQIISQKHFYGLQFTHNSLMGGNIRFSTDDFSLIRSNTINVQTWYLIFRLLLYIRIEMKMCVWNKCKRQTSK